MTFRAPSAAEIAYATYNVVNVLSVDIRYMAVIVIYRVPTTVKTTRVTHKMEHVIHVNLDGLDYTVKQVLMFIAYVIKLILY